MEKNFRGRGSIGPLNLPVVAGWIVKWSWAVVGAKVIYKFLKDQIVIYSDKIIAKAYLS